MYKKKNYAKFIIPVVFIYILVMSVGYAIYEDTLTIHGVASTLDYNSSTMLPVEPVMLNPQQNIYHSINGSLPNTEFYKEEWIGDTLYISYKKLEGISMAEKQIVKFYVSFTNPSAVTYTDGQFERVKTGAGNSTTDDFAWRLEEFEDTIEPGATTTVRMDLYVRFNTLGVKHQWKSTLSYNVQGVTKHLNIILNYE